MKTKIDYRDEILDGKNRVTGIENQNIGDHPRKKSNMRGKISDAFK